MAEDNSTSADNAPSADDTSPPPSGPADELDDELSEAARTARAEPYSPGGKMPPVKTMRIFFLVIAIIVATGVYAIVYSTRVVQENQVIRHQKLEEMQWKYELQQEFEKKYGYIPAGKTLKPLSPEMQQELEELRKSFGRLKFPPAENPSTVPSNIPPVGRD